MNSSRSQGKRMAVHAWLGLLLLASATSARANITLFISDSQGPRGGAAPITVSLQGDGRDVAGVDIDLLFDAAVFGAPAHVTDICAAADSQVHICLGGGNNFQQCTTNSDCPDGVCNNAFGVTGTVDVPAPPEGKHRLELSITQPIMNPPPPPMALGNGPIFVCNLAILADAPLGATVVEGSGPAAFDFNAVSLTPISVGSSEGETGTVTITEAPTPTNTPGSSPTPTVTPGVCKIDTDCPPSQICLDQVCKTQECDGTGCPAPRECVGNVCVPRACEGDSNCTPPAICVQHGCQYVPCDDCPEGYVCNESTSTCALPTPVPSETATPTETPTIPPPTATMTPTPTATPSATPVATLTPTPSVPPTNTNTPTNTPKPTNTPSPVPSATPKAQAQGLESDGCNMSQPGSGGAPSGVALLWLLVPAAIMVYRRRR